MRTAKTLSGLSGKYKVAETEDGCVGPPKRVHKLLDDLHGGPVYWHPLFDKSPSIRLRCRNNQIVAEVDAVVEKREPQTDKRGRPRADLIRYHDAPPRCSTLNPGGRQPKYVYRYDISPDQRPASDKVAEVDAVFRDIVRNGKYAESMMEITTPEGRREWVGFPFYRARPNLKTRLGSSERADHYLSLASDYPFVETFDPFHEDKFDLVKRIYRTGPQLKVSPSPGKYPTWQHVLRHTGANLDSVLPSHPWGSQHKVKTGEEYLFLWFASLVNRPRLPLPYLYLWSHRQNTGKSILYEATHLYLFDVVSADRVLSGDKFNKALATGVLAYIEETDLSRSKGSYEQVKQLTTAATMSVRGMYQDAVEQDCCLHFIQCANSDSNLPISWGDTRTMFLEVPPLEVNHKIDFKAALAAGVEGISPTVDIPKPLLLEALKAEAPAFLHALLRMKEKLPPPAERLALPAISTPSKELAMLASVPWEVRFIVEWAKFPETKLPWQGTTRQLAEAIDHDEMRDRRTLAKLVRSEAGAAYLSDHGIVVDFPGGRRGPGTLVTVSRRTK